MSEQIAVRIPSEELSQLDQLIADGRYPNRAVAVRAALERLLGEERDRAISESYRRAYAEAPQEGWFAEASTDAMGQILAGREPTEPA